MIVRELYKTREDGVNLYRSYSDTKHKIQQEQTGNVYYEAIDVETAPYTYVETEEVIPEEFYEEQERIEEGV